MKPGLARLTPREIHFIREYLYTLNEHDAQKKAGYSAEKGYASILKRPRVRAIVSRLAANVLSQPKDALKLKIRREYEDVAFSNMTDLLNEEMALDPDKLRANGHKIKKMRIVREKVTRSGEGEDEAIVTEQIIEIEFWDKMAALSQLAKYAELIKDTPQVNIEKGLVVIVNGQDPKAIDAATGIQNQLRSPG